MLIVEMVSRKVISNRKELERRARELFREDDVIGCIEFKCGAERRYVNRDELETGGDNYDSQK